MIHVVLNKKMTFQYLPVFIENEAGTLRYGATWIQKMANDYGYIEGTVGADGDEVDCFIGPNKQSTKIFIIDQVKPNGDFDEHKVMLGFNNIEEAKESYLSNYQKGWNGLGHIGERDIFSFWDWYNANSGQEDHMDVAIENQRVIVALNALVNVDNLDELERRHYKHFTGNGLSPQKALEVIINGVDGDFSQMRPELQRYARSIGLKDGDGGINVDHKYPKSKSNNGPLNWKERMTSKADALHRGRDRYASVQRQNCISCNGTGRVANYRVCATCEGTGCA